jgi:parvulin-like peptidyl-prolyl isomerase
VAKKSRTSKALKKLKLNKKDAKKAGGVALTKAKDLIKGESAEPEPTQSVRITNDSLAKYREEVLGGARRFIYPLQHSKHRIAIISGIIIFVITLILLVSSWFMLYRQGSTSDFAYRITQVIPFPIARVDGSFVRYEEYLFELRQNMHYLENQESVDFESEEGQAQLASLKTQAMERILDRAVTAQLAREYNVEVSDFEVEEQIDLIRLQGGVGDQTQTLEDTLDDFYGWDLGDLRRVIRYQIRDQKLVPLLDTAVKPEAEAVLADVLAGEDFAQAAKDHSEDALTKDNGGILGEIFRSNTDIPPQLVERAFSLKEGEVSDQLVETLFGFHIVKNLEYTAEDQVRVAHILFRYEDVDTFVEEREAEANISIYIDVEPEITQSEEQNDQAPQDTAPTD